MLTLGFFTLPFSSAAGWPGSCSMRNGERSVPTLRMPTSSAPTRRSISLLKLMVLRRNGSAPGVEPVDSALARFSEMICRRLDCVCNPEPAMREIAASGSIIALSFQGCHEHAVERLDDAGGKRMFPRRAAGFHQFLLDADAVAGMGDGPGIRLVGARLAGAPVELEMRRAGRRHLQAGMVHHLPKGLHVLGAIAGRVDIRDVLGDRGLAHRQPFAAARC